MKLTSEKYIIAEKALLTLKDILNTEKTIIMRDACIQRFEYTTEAVWKCLKSYLKMYEGIICYSPKMCYKEAGRTGLLNEEETQTALVMIDDRNLTSHTYHEEVAEKIFNNLSGYVSVMNKLLSSIKSRL